MSERLAAAGLRGAGAGLRVAVLTSSPDRANTIPEAREPAATRNRQSASLVAEGLFGSPILKIAAEVRALAATGKELCNLTVGDFAPTEFQVPELLKKELATAVQKGETNYPPSTGVQSLRNAVIAFC